MRPKIIGEIIVLNFFDSFPKRLRLILFLNSLLFDVSLIWRVSVRLIQGDYLGNLKKQNLLSTAEPRNRPLSTPGPFEVLETSSKKTSNSRASDFEFWSNLFWLVNYPKLRASSSEHRVHPMMKWSDALALHWYSLDWIPISANLRTRKPLDDHCNSSLSEL